MKLCQGERRWFLRAGSDERGARGGGRERRTPVLRLGRAGEAHAVRGRKRRLGACREVRVRASSAAERGARRASIYAF